MYLLFYVKKSNIGALITCESEVLPQSKFHILSWYLLFMCKFSVKVIFLDKKLGSIDGSTSVFSTTEEFVS